MERLFEQSRPQPEVIGRFAVLARSPAAGESRHYGIERSSFVIDLNKLTTKVVYSREKKTSGKIVVEREGHERPAASELTSYLLRTLDIDPMDPAVTTYLSQSSKYLSWLSETDPEATKKIGESIPKDAPVRVAYAELDDAVSDFHGSAYDGELRYVKALIFHAVEQAAGEQRLD